MISRAGGEHHPESSHPYDLLVHIVGLLVVLGDVVVSQSPDP